MENMQGRINLPCILSIKARFKRRKNKLCINHIGFQRKQSEFHTKDTIDYSIFGDIQKSSELERKTILSYAMC